MKRIVVCAAAMLAIVSVLSPAAIAQQPSPRTPAIVRWAETTPLPAGVPAGSGPATVTNYSDARAFVADLAGKEATVILIGLDAPDVHDGPAGDCFAAEALARLQQVIPVGTAVYLESDTKNDDGQGHLLRYVWLPGASGKSAALLNQKMVRDGFAAADTGGSKQAAKAGQSPSAASASPSHGKPPSEVSRPPSTVASSGRSLSPAKR